MDQTSERIHSDNSNNKRPVSLATNMKVGVSAAIIESGINHPLLTIKNRMQCGYHFTLDPRVLYRGVLGSAASMIPLVSIQVSANDILLTQFLEQPERAPIGAKLASSFAAGALSATVANPVELTLVQQQKMSQGFLYTGREFAKANGLGAFSSGLLATSLRTGIVSSGFIGLMPYFKQQFQAMGGKENLSTVAGGVCAGMISAVASHPFDTIKTLQQEAADVKKKTFTETAKNIFHKDGSVGFFRGITARGTRVISATVVLGHAKEVLTPKL